MSDSGTIVRRRNGSTEYYNSDNKLTREKDSKGNEVIRVNLGGSKGGTNGGGKVLDTPKEVFQQSQVVSLEQKYNGKVSDVSFNKGGRVIEATIKAPSETQKSYAQKQLEKNYLEQQKYYDEQQKAIQKEQAKQQLDIILSGGYMANNLKQFAEEQRLKQYKEEQERLSKINFQSGYYKRTEKLANRESKINDFNQKMFSTLKINENKDGNWFIEQSKGVVRFPISIPSGAFMIGGRVAFAVDSSFNNEGRQELKSAVGRVPSAVVQMYNPKNADFTANVLSTGLMFKGAIAQGKSIFGKTEVKYSAVKGKGDLNIKGSGTIKGQPYQEQTIIKNLKNPSESFSMIKQGKYDILIDRNPQTTTTTILNSKGNVIRQTKVPTTENYISLKPSGKPKVTIKENVLKNGLSTTELRYTKQATQNYKINDVTTQENVFTQTKTELKGTSSLTQKSKNVVIGKNPVTLIKKSKIEFDLNKGKVNPLEVERTFKTKQIEFVFDKETPKYSDIYINRINEQGLLEQGRITKPTYTQIGKETKKINFDVTYTEQTTPKNIFVGKYGNYRIPFSGQTIITDNPLFEKVKVSVNTPKLKTPQSLNIPKPITYIPSKISVFPLNVQQQKLKQNILNVPDYDTKINVISDIKPVSKVEQNVQQDIKFEQINKIDSRVKNKQELNYQQKVVQNVQQKVDQNIFEEFKQIEIQKQSEKPKVKYLSTPKIKNNIPLFPKAIKSIPLKGNKQAGFDVFVRRKGVFEKVNNNPLVKSQAIDYGAFRVSQEASASFKVLPSSKSALGSFSGGGNLFSNFYKSKREPNVFVQKRSNRISSFGEKREITFKGIQASKMRRNIFGR